MNLRTLHRLSAFLIAAFAAVHIANHLASLASISAHLRFMEVARALYRQPFVEGILLACVTFQCASGLWLVFAGWKQRRGTVAWVQAASGFYLALFLLIHVAAVMFGRAALGLDTNFFYAAAGIHVPPFQYFFVPYYFLAVVALFIHLGCAVYWSGPAAVRGRTLAVGVAAVGGAVVSLLLVLSLAGKIQPFEVPASYRSTYVRAGG
ncbi:hypothetical protein PQU95_17070 [Vogesella sp. DC21W]|uniref:Uncharacterized protein n=1 Tax=Vogesella aquatica TaxID=2984206 RepID=A0ABT5J269_9NEIS|nr:hypothetical protein [Vogesella aquatica]MDC7718916.1 hypothetical protein [Vogesella aquatica]